MSKLDEEAMKTLDEIWSGTDTDPDLTKLAHMLGREKCEEVTQFQLWMGNKFSDQITLAIVGSIARDTDLVSIITHAFLYGAWNVIEYFQKQGMEFNFEEVPE